MSGPRPIAAVLYNPPTLPADHPHAESEADVVSVAREIAAILDRGGFEARLVAAEPPVDRLVAELTGVPTQGQSPGWPGLSLRAPGARAGAFPPGHASLRPGHPKPDVVFNLIEGFGGTSAGESWITSLLEMLAFPYTGCPPEAQALCRQKGRTKALLRGFGLPTAPFFVARFRDVPDPPFEGPYFIKPDAEDASLGIDQGSVIVDRRDLADRVEKVHREFGSDALIETYLPGPEYNVGVLDLLDPVALTVAEVAYDPRPGEWPILTYAAKWDVGSAADLASPIRCPAAIDDGLAAELSRLAIAAFRVTGCRDVARVDFRLDAAGRPMILEVNPNPDLGPTAGWARALRASGRDYETTIIGLANQAITR